MTTPRIRSLVSLAATLTAAVALSGCVGASSRAPLEEPTPADSPQLAIRFENGARDFVRVYLVGAQREWMLGRVEPGARVMLRIPDEALADAAGFMQLAVLTGEHVTLRAGEARATLTIAQPPAEMRSQRWMFSQTLAKGELTALPLGRTKAGLGHQ